MIKARFTSDLLELGISRNCRTRMEETATKRISIEKLLEVRFYNHDIEEKIDWGKVQNATFNRLIFERNVKVIFVN